MEPLDDWMEDALVQVGAATVRLRSPKALQPVSQIDPTWAHPDEDCFQVPTMVGDELTAVPPFRDRSGPMQATASKGNQVQTEQAFQTFMNLASAAERMPSDAVTMPNHYARFKLEPIRFICENNLNFFQGNIIKYVLRHDAKNGLEDLRKARRYLNMFIKFVEGDADWWKADGLAA